MNNEKTIKGLWAVVKINSNRSSTHIVPNYIPVKIEDTNLNSVTFHGWAYGERLHEYPRSAIMITCETEEAANDYIKSICNENGVIKESVSDVNHICDTLNSEGISFEDVESNGDSVVITLDHDNCDDAIIEKTIQILKSRLGVNAMPGEYDDQIIINNKLTESNGSGAEDYSASSIESLNDYASGLGDACKDLKPGDGIIVKGYYVERSDDGQTYYVWIDLDESINEDAEPRKRISYRGYIIRPRKSDDGELYYDIIKPKWSTTEPIWDWCDSVEEAKQWIDSDKDEPFEESKSIKSVNELFELRDTGKEYDFIATVQNNTDSVLKFKFGEDLGIDNFEIAPNDWVGLLADANGRETYKAIKNKEYELDIVEVKPQFETNSKLTEAPDNKSINDDDDLTGPKLTEDEKDDILFTVAMGFETGHQVSEDFEEFKSEFSGISNAKAGWEYYCELVNLGPAGFYAEHKDDYIFDDMFIAEYGGESEEDEGPYLGKGKVSVTAYNNYGPGELPYWSGKKFDAKEWPEILKHFADTSHGSRPFEVLSVDGSEVSGWYVYNDKTGEYVFTTSNPQELLDKFNGITESINEDKYLYDITLDGNIVGDSGDIEFDTEDTAKADANKYIAAALVPEYRRDINDFKIVLYPVMESKSIKESEGRKATHTSIVYLVDYEDGLSLPFDDRDTAIDYAIDSDAKQVVKATMYHFSDDESDTDIDGDNSEVIWTAYPNPTTENLEESSKPDLYNVVDTQNDEHPDNSRIYTQAQMYDLCKELIEIEEESSEPKVYAKRPKLDYDLKSIAAVLKWFDYEVKQINAITEHYDDSPENYDNASRVLDNIEFVAKETGELDDEDWTKDMMQQTVNVLDDSVKELQDIVDNLPTAASVNESYDPFDVYSVYEIKDADTNEVIRKIHTTSMNPDDSSTWFDDDDIVSQYAGDGIIITRYDYDQGMLDKSAVIYPEEDEDAINAIYDGNANGICTEDINENENVQKWAIFADDRFQMYVNGTEDMAKEAIADMQKADEEDKALFIAHGLDMPVYRYELVKYVQSENPEISNMFKVEENFRFRQSNGIIG